MNRGNGGIFGKKNFSSIGGVYSAYEQQEKSASIYWPSGTDLRFPNTSLILKTGSQSTRNIASIVDSSINNFTFTKTGTPTTSWISPYQTNGYWSNYFGGASATWIQAADNANLVLGSSNYTIELWIYLISAPTTGGIITKGNNNSLGSEVWTLEFTNTTGSFAFFACAYSAGSPILTGTISLGTWNHIAVVRNGLAHNLYVNGTSVSNQTLGSSYTVAAGGPLYIGTGWYTPSSRYINAYISNARVMAGTALYTQNFTPLTEPLTAISGTSLLTCQSNRFIDNSTNNFAITVQGTPQITPYWYPSTFSIPNASLGAALFNGSTDYYSTTTNSAFSFGTGDLTIEAWIYNTSSSAVAKNIFGHWGGSGESYQFYLSTTNRLTWQIYTQNSTNSSTLAVPLNTWTHVAWTKSGTTSYLYINGVLQDTVTGVTNSANGGEVPRIGAGQSGTQLFPGYISNLRIVKGIAVYTGNFTPPTNFLTQTGGTYPSTANVNTSITSSNTSLLVNFSDSNYSSIINAANNNLFIDSSFNALTVTRNGTPTQGSFSPYEPDGYWSNYFDGSSTSGALALTQAASNAIFPSVNSGGFTIEFWVFINAATATFNTVIVGAWTGTNNQIWWEINCNSTGFNITFGANGFGQPSSNITSTTPFVSNKWTHVVLQRRSNGTNWDVFHDGANVYANQTSTYSFNLYTVAPIRIGFGYGNGSLSNLAGFYLSNFRISNSPIYPVAGFTPQTTPFTPISGTSLLTCQSNRFIDNSSNNYALTVSNNPRIQVHAFRPFPLPKTYTPTIYGGSGYFNGTTDYLSISAPDGGVLDVSGGSNFTIEVWFYITNTGTNNIYSRGGTNGSQNAQYWASITNGSLQWGFGNGGVGAAISNITGVQYNCWNHFAVTLNGTTFTPYVNGVAYTTVTLTFTIPTSISNPTLWIGGAADPGARLWVTGYITGFRLVKGVVVYTGNFTPPSVPLTAIANTSLLVNSTNAGIYDAAAQNDLVTVSGAQVSNTVVKFPLTTSMKFNGTSDYLTAPVIPAYSFGAGDFTVEGWFFFNAFNTAGGGDNWLVTLGTGYNGGGPYNAWAMRYNASAYGNAVLGFVRYDGTDYANHFSLPSANYLVTGTWYHIAAARSGTSLKMFLNGTAIGTTITTSLAFNAVNTDPLQVGKFVTGAGTFYHNGYMQDIRITKGFARYTANTAPPSLPFPTTGRDIVQAIDYLVVAGGGGGGYNVGGGGGAGGLLTGATLEVIPGNQYTITVGGGGAAGTSGSTIGANGTPSVFGPFNTVGGGAGGGFGDSPIATGLSGGSGGGGAMVNGGGTVQGGSGTSGQGYSGGTGVHVPGQYAYSGGGGGAGAAGTNGGPGNGGIGIQTSITGTSTYYAGGGGGGGSGAGAGGSGGGGGVGVSASANTGGGGGGSNASAAGGSGGGGIVVIAYPINYSAISTISPGLSYTIDTTTRVGWRVYKFFSGTGTILF